MAETVQALADDLAATARRLGDTRSLMQAMTVAAGADLQQGMTAGVDVHDRPLAPLAMTRVRGGAGLPLMDTGLLRASLAAGPGHVERVTATEAVIGTNRVGAALLNEGGIIEPKGHPFLAIPRTPEAFAAGSPRNFPRPLSPIIGKVGGVLIERVPKQSSAARAVARQIRGQGGDLNRAQGGTVQYILTRRVTVPERQFVGVGQRLLGKLGLVAQDWCAQRFGLRSDIGAGMGVP